MANSLFADIYKLGTDFSQFRVLEVGCGVGCLPGLSAFALGARQACIYPGGNSELLSIIVCS